MQIRLDDPLGTHVAPLMALHIAGVSDGVPPENTHVLGAAALVHPAITFWTAWHGESLAGFIALRELDDALACDVDEVCEEQAGDPPPPHNRFMTLAL